MRAYAIGDIHGHLDLLEAAHARIAADRAATGDHVAPVIHLGDLVDRGPDSRGVVEFLSAGCAAGRPWVVLQGNHDYLFSLFLDDPDAVAHGRLPAHAWLEPNIGGASTLASYGVQEADARPLAEVHRAASTAVPASHRRFMAARPGLHRAAGAIFVHAGIRPGIALEKQSLRDLLWIRDSFLGDRRDHGALVVHGHTAIDAPTHYGNRVNIDSGAAWGGPLSAVVVEEGAVWLLGPAGRQPLRREWRRA